MIILENGELTLEVTPRGAEMESLKRGGAEVLWEANLAFWNRHAPVLFPIVGGVGDSYLHRGRRYPMGQHGFARNGVFTVERQSADEVTLLLRDTEETRVFYPFAFELRIGYKLAGPAVEVSYQVDNPAAGELLFSIGAHPGFRCPLLESLSYEDYSIEFDEPETLDAHFLINNQLSLKTEPVLRGERRLRLHSHIFDRGALIFKGLRSAGCTLKSDRGGPQVRVEFPGFPYLGLWAVPGAPFVCIEPWFGVNDPEGFAGEFAEKPGVLRLGPGESFECAHKIVVEA